MGGNDKGAKLKKKKRIYKIMTSTLFIDIVKANRIGRLID